MFKKHISAIVFTSFLLVSTTSQADYVSPTEYKNHSCDELQEDYLGYLEASFKYLSESINYSGTKRARTATDKREKLDARIAAIKKASERKNCLVKTPKELADSK
jgi:predicted SPOUT superfamily RNA methylase MTH1